jgi:hypothetical protein
MALAIEIGMAWFALSIPVGIFAGKAIKRVSPSPAELWSIHHGGGMQ